MNFSSSAHGGGSPIHRRDYQIKPITLRDVNDLYRLREIVERAVLRIAAGRVDEASLQHLDKVCSESYTPFDRHSEERLLARQHRIPRTERRFHRQPAANQHRARCARPATSPTDGSVRRGAASIRLTMPLRLASAAGIRNRQTAANSVIQGLTWAPSFPKHNGVAPGAGLFAGADSHLLRVVAEGGSFEPKIRSIQQRCVYACSPM